MKLITDMRSWAGMMAMFLFACALGSCAPVRNVSGRNQNSPSVTIAAVGDINGYNITADTQDPLGDVKKLLSGDDIFIFNAESVFSNWCLKSCRSFPKQSTFLSSPSLLNYIPTGNLTVASLANNHTFDCGNEGLSETIAALQNRQIVPLGAGLNSEEACRPLAVRLNGLRLAMLSYLVTNIDKFYADVEKSGTASLQYCNGYAQISKIREQDDFVIVILHSHLPYACGYEWVEKPHPKIITVVQSLLDAGADLIIASGPHVPQAIMIKDARVALLSLGNFIFDPDYKMPDKAHNSLLAKMTITMDSFKLCLIPIKLDIGGKPTLPSPQEALSILGDIEKLSNELGTTLKISGGAGCLEMAHHKYPFK